MLWSKIAASILRFRIFYLLVITGLTVFMALQVNKLKMDYGYSGMMPDSDSVSINLEDFRNTFGGDANIILLGVQDSNFFMPGKINDWVLMREKLIDVTGVQSAYSVTEAVKLVRNSENGEFEIEPVFIPGVNSRPALDSMANELHSLPIYDGLLYSRDKSVYLMVLSMDQDLMDSKSRENIIAGVQSIARDWGDKHGRKIHFTGLPLVRSTYMVMIKAELLKFIYLAAAVVFILLFIFFRSLKAVIPSIIVVGMGVLWAFGTMAILDYKVTVLTGMIPPLIIVIGVPNCVFLLNKYHQEYKKHANKIKALQRAIQRVGYAIFLTNLTTAAGFATFMVVNNQMLARFGLVAALNIMILFVLSVFLIPIIFSFLPSPSINQIKHLDHKVIRRIIEVFSGMIIHKRKLIYISFAVLLCLSGWGISKMKTTGFIVDDIKHDHPLYIDLKFFEKNLTGVMPLEISIDTKRPQGIFRERTLKQVEKFQDRLEDYPELSRSLSVVDGLKFARQAYFRGGAEYYKLPSRQELNFILAATGDKAGDNYMLRMLVDSTQQKLRINLRVADIGVERMLLLKDSLQSDLGRYFPSGQYRAVLTGSSLTFTLGTHYLVRNLFISLGLAIILISLFMAWMFSSPRMVLISIFPNLLPLLITAGIMGFSSISIRPSTILIFSIAFGISVDTAIHFLAKFKQELDCRNTPPSEAVVLSLKEVGVSIIYTVIILFFGFGIFVASEFGGTAAMGLLTSITLFVAMLANLLLVPSILMGMARAGKLSKMKTSYDKIN